MRAPFTSRTMERLMRDTAMIAHDAVTRGLRPYLKRTRREQDDNNGENRGERGGNEETRRLSVLRRWEVWYALLV